MPITMLALSAAFWSFDLFLVSRRWVFSGQGDLLFLGFLLLRAAGLAVAAVLVWRYGGAVRDYRSGGTPAARLERAHAAVWRWGAYFLAALGTYGVVLIAMRMPL
jgi:hypothetical protein